MFRAYLMDLMDHQTDENLEQTKKFVSPKILTMLNILREDTTGKKTIIFAQRRSTTIVLAQILRKFTTHPDSDVNYVKSAFIIGGKANPLKGDMECFLETKWNRKVYDR